MKVIYTRHAEEKLKRKDIENFRITKKTINTIIRNPRSKSKTKYGNLAALDEIDPSHDLRIIYDIIDSNIKVITFHVARKGRYK